MREDLIESLQLKLDVWRGTEFGDDICELLEEAADAIEALRAEVGELHMHAKRRDQYAVEKAAQALDWKKRAEQLAEALEEIRSRSSINLAMHPDPSALTARLGDIYQIADAALAREGGQ